MDDSVVRSLPRDDSIPQTVEGFRTRFATEKACVAFLRRWRYPDGFRCPGCGHDASWWLPSRRLDQCQACDRQVSLTSGTLFHRTRKPLRLWFQAMFLFVSSKRSLSALELQRQIGVSYPTAWTWLHKLRHAMDARHKELLQGTVEVDEAYVGGAEERRGGRSTQRKAVIAAAIEVPRDRPGFGRLRLKHLPDATRASLEEFIEESVAKEAQHKTDAWVGYGGLEARGRIHRQVNVSADSRQAHQVLPGVHRVFSLLRRVLLGTYHGAVRWKHLHRYLAAYEFSFNRRGSEKRSLLFQRLLSAGLLGPSPSYHDLVAGIGTHPRFLAPRT